MGGILFQRGVDLGLGITEELTDLLIGAKTQRTQECGDGQLAVLIDADIEDIGRIRLILQPGAAVGVHGRGEQILTGTVLAGTIENTGRANQLADNHALGTVGDKGTGIRHQREIPHEDLLLLDLAGLLIQKTGCDVQRRRIGGVTLFAFLNGIFGMLVQAVIDEFQRKVAGIILDRANVMQHLAQALVQEPVVRVFLNLNEVGHSNHFIDTGKAHSGGSTVLYGLDLDHKMRPLLFHRL